MNYAEHRRWFLQIEHKVTTLVKCISVDFAGSFAGHLD